MESVSILGVRVDKVNMDQAVGLVESWLKGKDKHYIVTPNPEFVMAAQKDLEFKKILNKADLAIPDGAGLKLARFADSSRRASDIVSTIPGVDFLESLCKLSSEKGFTVGFLGGQNGVAKEARECLQKKYQNLNVVFAEDGPVVNMEGEIDKSDKIGISENQSASVPERADSQSNRSTDFLISSGSPIDLLFVAFGQVKQEKWIAKNLDQIPVKVAMGVGGSFDYLSGRVPRAPKFMRNLGLEWLFRLILQPWRIKRQLVLLKFFFLAKLK